MFAFTDMFAFAVIAYLQACAKSRHPPPTSFSVKANCGFVFTQHRVSLTIVRDKNTVGAGELGSSSFIEACSRKSVRVTVKSTDWFSQRSESFT